MRPFCYTMDMSEMQHPPPDSVRRDVLERLARGMLIITTIATVLLATIVGWRVATRPSDPASAAAPTASPQPSPSPTHDPAKPLVGIVAGHSGSDSGAVCPDGLTEADINLTVAETVIADLRRKGVDAILLQEFDPRLRDLRADALVSIHADSCNIPGATGFKVARATDSAIPQAEDALVRCIIKTYGDETGLPLHPGSVTDDMTQYHAFYEVAPTTPGAIIETGFMLDDRNLLENHPQTVAKGIARGILCFLGGDLGG